VAGNFRHFHTVNNAVCERKTDRKMGRELLWNIQAGKEKGMAEKRANRTNEQW